MQLQIMSIIILQLLLLYSIFGHVETTPTPQKVLLSMENTSSETNLLKPKLDLRKCFKDSDCEQHSWCNKAYECECEKGWITWHNSRHCSYKQSSKILALILSFVMGFIGADWFILSRKDSLYILCGILKILLSAGCCIWNPLAARSKSRTATTAASCLSVTLTLISFVWWFVDWIRILLNSFPDGNGAPLI
ncbi:unnamed protein product [Adineta steineri]|uniref:Uncharacterized protein n=1 Tax=Adineta steineri TaxID=433720 RepID=A0A819UZK1_9BILA|nr:unnamed protein product [Adineta steineri]CAF0945901.1 unnamed protein product [Adineta steineri]CAF3550167.1 unnamed protein product [Adineta steineri]CAF4103927.1 unnamed protein product [Adineta steineri]